MRSRDAGRSWQTVNDHVNIAARPFYFCDIRVDPRDPSRVFVTGSSLAFSQDGGRTWGRNRGTSAFPTAFGDFRMRVALLTTFAASRKEPLVAMLNRVHQAFGQAGLAAPFLIYGGALLVAAGVTSLATAVATTHGLFCRRQSKYEFAPYV